MQGILITPVDPEAAILDDIVRRGTPVVIVDRTRGDGDASARSRSTTSSAAGSRSSTSSSCGHTRVAFVGGPADARPDPRPAQGAQAAWADAGLPADHLPCAPRRSTVADGARGRRAAPRPARPGAGPTAAFCANDLTALGLLQQCIRAGRRVPDDIAIVGYDDIEFAAAAAVPLTSVRSRARSSAHGRPSWCSTSRSRGHLHEQVVFVRRARGAAVDARADAGHVAADEDHGNAPSETRVRLSVAVPRLGRCPPPNPSLAARGRRRRHPAALGLGVRRDPPPRPRLLGRARCRSAGWWSARSRSGPSPSRAACPGRAGATGWAWSSIGVLWFGVYNLALNQGERHVDAGTAAMLIQISPVLIALLATLFLGERFTRLARPRAAARVRRRRADRRCPSPAATTTSRGAALPARGARLLDLAGRAEAAGRRASRRSTSPGWRARSARSSACRSPASSSTTPRDASASDIWWVVYLGLFPTAIAFTTYAFALRHMTASSLGITTYLVPPLTIVMGWLFLGEVPPTMAYAGGALALVGVAVARRKPRAREGGAAAGLTRDPPGPVMLRA